MMDDFFEIKKKKVIVKEEEPVKKKLPGLFEYLKEIMHLKKGNMAEKDPGLKGFSVFMILRYLSLEESYLPFITIIDKYQGSCTKEQMYKQLLILIPKANKFLAYPKAEDKKYDDKNIDLVKKYFECSRNDVLEFLRYGFINDRDIQIIKEKYGGRM